MTEQNKNIEIGQMFDRIAQRYDLLNKVLSLGLDCLWRRKLSSNLPEKNNLQILDIATGTADLLLSIFKKNKNITAVGLDISEKMLAIAHKKITARNLQNRITLNLADANSLPFPDNTFDVITTAFGIRNLPDTVGGLKEMLRVLKPAGKVLILEFSLPQNLLIRKVCLLYLRNIVPLIGKLISGNYDAYRYLNRTIEAFPSGPDFCALMQKAGFINTHSIPLTFGIVSLYTANKN